MRILVVSYEWPDIGGGAGIALRSICREWSRTGVEFDVVTSYARHRLPGCNAYERSAWGWDEAKPASIRIDRLGRATIYQVGITKASLRRWTRREMLSWVLKARKYIRRLRKFERYDCLLIWSAVPSAWAVTKNIPYAVSLQGSDVPGHNKRFFWDQQLVRFYVQRLCLKAHDVVANSQGLSEEATDLRIDRIVPNGVSVSEFPFYRRQLHSPMRLLAVGRDVPTKRFADLRLICEGYDLKIVSDCPHSQIADYYRWADVYVSASHKEGMSLSMLEALATGLPCAVYPHGGSEILPKPWVSPDILPGIRNIEQNYEAACKTARQIATKYSWSNVAEQWLHVMSCVSAD